MNFILIAIVLISVFCAFRAQSAKTLLPADGDSDKQIFYYSKFDKRWFLASFFFLAMVCFLCGSGNDIPGYYQDYLESTITDRSVVDTEVGYVALNAILSIFIKNPVIGIGIVKIISIGLIFIAIYNLRNKVNVGISVLSYICLLYLFNFQLLRMMLAVGLVFLALSYEVIGSTKKCIMLLIASVFFHYSSFVVWITFLVYLYLKKRHSIFQVLTLVVFLPLLVYFSSDIISYLVENIKYFGKYSAYTSEAVESGGVGQLLFFIPVAFIVFSYYKFEKNESIYYLSLLCGIMTFIIGVLGYTFPVISRATYFFYFFFIYYGASIPLKTNGNIFLKTSSKRIHFQAILTCLYVVFFFTYYVYMGGLKNAGLDTFIFAWEVRY